MKVLALLAAAALSAAQVLAGDGRRGLPEIFRPGDFILFQGDSITDGGRAGDMNHYMGHGYQTEIAMRYLSAFPTNALTFANRAVSGHTTADLRARWQTDALEVTNGENGYAASFGADAVGPRTPDVMSLLIGVNDRFYRNRPVADYETDLRYLVESAFEKNPEMRIILCEPFRCPQSDDVEFMKVQGFMARLALEKGLPLVKFQRLVNEKMLALNPDPAYWSWDTVHPTIQAHMLMAGEWIKTFARHLRRPETNPALVPQTKLEQDSYDWYERHARILREQKAMDPQIVFLGDSITHFWAGRDSIGGDDAEPRWKEAFGKYRTLDLGFGWDRTQNLLWRLDHGEMDGLDPKLLVMMIGTNNNSETPNARRCESGEIFAGVVECAKRAMEKAPGAHLALFAIFPRGETPNPDRENNDRANAMLEEWASQRENVTFVDIGGRFLDGEGKIPKELMDDYLHPTDEGYKIWAEALGPVIEKYVR